MSDRAQRHLDEVERITDKVTKESPGGVSGDESTGEQKIRRVKWIMHSDDIQKVEAEMKELQDTLGLLFVLMQPCVFNLSPQ